MELQLTIEGKYKLNTLQLRLIDVAGTLPYYKAW
jgi:hypothetical protein